MPTAHVTLYFGEKYIADPYWPEREELINIQKNSGMNRARSEQKREETLKEYLRRNGYSLEQYAELERLSRRPFYTNEKGQIILSTHQMYGCLIEAARNISASQRPCEPNNLRHVLRLTDFVTTKRQSDGVFKRLVMPKSGTGQPLSNQRALRMNDYIADFEATGTLSFFPEDIRSADELPDFLTYAGQRIGVGASRKMGCGRFVVKDFRLTEKA